MQKGRSIALRPSCDCAAFDQNENVAWKKIRRAAELVGEAKIPRARLEGLLEAAAGAVAAASEQGLE